jgi:hypothetical protein
MPRLSPAQIADVARRTAEDRRAQAVKALAPSPQEEKEHAKISYGIMRRRAAKRLGFL